MATMEWREVDPEQADWKKQINTVAYYGSQEIGSIVYDDTGWNSVIDGNVEFLNAETEEEAKEEMIVMLENHFEDQINYYRELIDSLEKLNP